MAPVNIHPRTQTTFISIVQPPVNIYSRSQTTFISVLFGLKQCKDNSTQKLFLALFKAMMKHDTLDDEFLFIAASFASLAIFKTADGMVIKVASKS